MREVCLLVLLGVQGNNPPSVVDCEKDFVVKSH